MNNFKRGGFKQRSGGPGGRPKFGNKFGSGRSGGDRSAGRMELFSAVCSECKKSCQVPFRPTGDKPVYCRDCFNKQPQIPGRNSNGRDPRPRHEHQPEYVTEQHGDEINTLKRQLIEIESKIDRILDLVSQNIEDQITEDIAPPKITETKRTTRKVTTKQ